MHSADYCAQHSSLICTDQMQLLLVLSHLDGTKGFSHDVRNHVLSRNILNSQLIFCHNVPKILRTNFDVLDVFRQSNFFANNDRSKVIISDAWDANGNFHIN